MQGNDPVFLALTRHYPGSGSFKIEIIPVKAQEFRSPDSSIVEHGKDELVPYTGLPVSGRGKFCRIYKPFDLMSCHDLRDFVYLFRDLNPACWVSGYNFFFIQVIEKAFKYCTVFTERRGGKLTFFF